MKKRERFPLVDVSGKISIRGGESVPIIKRRQADRGKSIAPDAPSDKEVEEILLGKAREGDPTEDLLMRLDALQADANTLFSAKDDIARFEALVAAAAHKDNKHKETVLRLAGCRLVTANILYRLPDFSSLLQQYIWQDLDMEKLPRLRAFVGWWMRDLAHAPIKEVHVGESLLWSPKEVRTIADEWSM